MGAKGDITFGRLTHAGILREDNQDALSFYDPEETAQLDLRGRLMVVADGVGGHPGGETAAKTAVESIRATYEQSDGLDPARDLREALLKANRDIHALSRKRKALVGMGTTCTAMVIRGTEAYVAHVGDSRAYILRKGKLTQLTKDHSAAWALLEKGKITKAEYERHPKSRVIQRSLGFQSRVQVDVSPRPLRLRQGDILILCSDGLTGVVPEEDISRIASKHPPQEACVKLVQQAIEAGGPDNITVQIARVETSPDPSSRRPPPKEG